MPLVATLCFLFHALLLFTLSAYGQSTESSVFVYVNDTSKWSTRGNWTLIHVLDNFADNWLLSVAFILGVRG